MKAINTIIISGLLAFSMNTTVAAGDFEKHTAEMNRVLQKQIEARINLADEEVTRKLQTRAIAESQTGSLNVSLDQNLLVTPS